jgi:hypothetical protein
MNWKKHIDDCGGYSWSYELPNGWTAGVSDLGKSIAPVPPTTYHVFASCRNQFKSNLKTYSSFEEAKRQALDLAMNQ